MIHKNTNLLLWEIQDDMRLSTAKGSESTKCKTEISEGKNRAYWEQVCSEGVHIFSAPAWPVQDTSETTERNAELQWQPEEPQQAPQGSPKHVRGQHFLELECCSLPSLLSFSKHCRLFVNSLIHCRLCLPKAGHSSPPSPSSQPVLVLMGYFSPHISLLSASLSSRAGPVSSF